MKRKILFATIVSVLMIIQCNTVLAEGIETLEGRRVYIEEQLQERNLQMEALQERITDTLAGISALDERIETHTHELNVLNLQLIRVTRDVEEAEVELYRIEETYLIHRRAFEQRLVAQYIAGETRYLDVLLSSNSLVEFVSTFFLISEVAQHDANLMSSIERQRRALSEARYLLTERQAALRRLTDNERRTIVALENTRIIRNDYVRRLSEEEQEVQAQIDGFRVVLANIEDEIMALAVLHMDGTFVGGEFAWPAPGFYRITSPFGIRIHPIFRYSRMHTGLDIGMPTGAAIVAANDGVVIRAGYMGGYGNTVMIDHGGGVITLYAHGSRILSNVGDRVGRGQPIMLAGSTGWSTGPHLHFEIRINGIFVDPLPYITRRATIPTNTEPENVE